MFISAVWFAGVVVLGFVVGFLRLPSRWAEHDGLLETEDALIFIGAALLLWPLTVSIGLLGLPVWVGYRLKGSKVDE